MLLKECVKPVFEISENTVLLSHDDPLFQKIDKGLCKPLSQRSISIRERFYLKHKHGVWIFAEIENQIVSCIAIVLDESFLEACDIDRVNGNDRFIPNVRISKLGGLVNTLRLVEATRQKEIPIVLGSLVDETSILTRLWLVVSALCRSTIYAAEGANSAHLLKDDITEIPIFVKPPGVVEVPETILKSPGLGIEISAIAQKYLEMVWHQQTFNQRDA